MHRTFEDPRRWHRTIAINGTNVGSETLNSNQSPTGAHAPNPILSTRRNCIKHYKENKKQTGLHSRIMEDKESSINYGLSKKRISPADIV